MIKFHNNSIFSLSNGLLLWLLLFSYFATGCVSVKNGALTGDQIRTVVAGNTLVITNQQVESKWFFNSNGVHVFDPSHGYPVSGEWYVWREGHKLCWWEVDPDIPDCAAVDLNDDQITLKFDNHSSSAKLVAGNKTDLTDNPGIDFDPSRNLAIYDLLDVKIIPPQKSVSIEKSKYLGAWYGSWYDFRDFALIIDEVDQESVKLIYAWGPNKNRDGDVSGTKRAIGHFEGNSLKIKLWENSITGVLQSDGKLRIDWITEGEGIAFRSFATRWPNPPWETPTLSKLEPPKLSDSRSKLNLASLLDSKTGDNPIHTSYFSALGPDIGSAHQQFQGRIDITLSNAIGRQPATNSVRDFPGLPEVSLEFISVRDELVPLERQRLITRGSNWDLIVEPGRIWSEASDKGWSRAAFPFALIEKGDTLLRNGLATFVYTDTQVSPIHFQIGKESSATGHLDLWGFAQATYVPGLVIDIQESTDAYEAEIARRIDLYHWKDLEDQYDKQLLDQFDGNRIRRHMSQSGLIIDGKAYTSDCHTRYGPQPYCRFMRHAVYSVTKPLVGWLTSLRLAQKYGTEILDYRVSDYVNLETNSEQWKHVSFNHLLSMVSGIGEVEPTPVEFYVESLGTENDRAYARAETTADKLAVVERIGFYPWAPGEEFRYTRYDPFILAIGLQELYRTLEGPDADLWDMMQQEVFKPIGIAHLPIRKIRSTDQDDAVAMFSNGAWVTFEDVAKIEALIRADGKFAGQQILHPDLTKQPFQQNVEAFGYPTGWINNTGEESYYFNFWLFGKISG